MSYSYTDSTAKQVASILQICVVNAPIIYGLSIVSHVSENESAKYNLHEIKIG